MNMQIEQTLTSLRSRNINGIFAENSRDVCIKVLNLISKDSVVGIGDSTTVRQTGVIQALKERGTNVLDAFDTTLVQMNPKDAQQYHNRIVREATVCDVFLTGTNAITLDGILINVDATGNRAAGMFWGHPLSIIVVGKNKIVTDLNEAFRRIRNIIAPNHIRIRSAELGGRKFRTPCVVTGLCNDCKSFDRACNIFTIIEGKPFHTNLNVIIVNEDLGLGWNPSWSESRILQIVENYKTFVWISIRNDT